MFSLTKSKSAGHNEFEMKYWPASTRQSLGRSKDVLLHPILEALTSELQHIALVTAIAASGVNAIKEITTGDWLQGLMPYAAPNLLQLGSLRSMARKASDGLDPLYAVDGYLLAHGDALTSLELYLQDASEMGAERASVLHLHHVTRLWRNTCVKAVAALCEMETIAIGAISELHQQNTKVLTELLTSVANGFKPCVSSGNQLIFPPLPQQRRWPRRSLLQNCVVTIAGKTFKAFVRDASAGGFGLDRMPVVTAGQAISVELATGRCLAGTVAWYRDTSAGMIFSKSLMPTDPLIYG